MSLGFWRVYEPTDVDNEQESLPKIEAEFSSVYLHVVLPQL